MKRYLLLVAASLLSFGGFAQAPSQDPSQSTPLAFEALDKNADQKLTPSEAASDQGLAQDFTAADTNQDGYISREEFDAYHQG